MRAIRLVLLFITILAGWTPASADTGGKERADNVTRVMSTPIEPLLPCTAEDDLIVYTLMAADQKNIQIAIECRNGILKAKWPSKNAETLEDIEER